MPYARWMPGATHKPPDVRAAIAVAAVFFIAGAGWRRSHARAPIAPPDLPRVRIPHKGERILVFAPHPDDETLGLGAFLHLARQRGAEVRVAFLTSGDGFPLCAAARYHRWPNRARMRRLASDREREATAALGRLGVPGDHLTFFRYPDRGIAALWQTYWTAEQPYRSPYTGESAVPKPAGGSARPFCGASVLQDTDALLRSYRPDRVYYPDPADDHPDHWATHCFVQLALERLRGEPWAAELEARTYLIHRGEWPQPLRTDRSLYLTPPQALTGTDRRWESLLVSADHVEAKSAALQEYRSQEVLAGNFLNAFLRRNELLGYWPTVSQGVPLPDATGDRFARSRWGSVDFTRFEVEGSAREVQLSATLRDPVAAWPAYYVYWKPVSGGAGSLGTRRCRVMGYRGEPSNTRFAIDGRRIRITVPRAELGNTERIMVGASAWSGPVLLDRIPWRVVDLTRTGNRVTAP